MLEEDSVHTSSPEPDPLANNPYLNREKCLLCQRDRLPEDESDSEGIYDPIWNSEDIMDITMFSLTRHILHVI